MIFRYDLLYSRELECQGARVMLTKDSPDQRLDEVKYFYKGTVPTSLTEPLKQLVAELHQKLDGKTMTLREALVQIGNQANVPAGVPNPGIPDGCNFIMLEVGTDDTVWYFRVLDFRQPAEVKP